MKFMAVEGMNMAAGKPGQPDPNIRFEWSAKIPLRDGIRLNATIYRPRSPDPVPAIFTLTPYIADSYHPRAWYFAQRGYAFGLVDCRGRGSSEGDFVPFMSDGPDAYDVVEWLAAQPWCDGQVGMWGGSYGGFNQWMAVKQFPPHLKTVVPAASAHAGVDFPFFKNIFFSYEIQWQTLVSGLTGNTNLFNEQQFWIEKFREMYLNHRPYKELDQIVGNPSTTFQTWLEHPFVDDYWRGLWLTPEEYYRIDLPILTITGSYDDDQPGALHYYREHMRHGSAQAKQQHILVVGPWDHAGTRTPQPEFGGMRFGEGSLVDLNRLHKEWYDWTLKGGPRPEFLKDRVGYYRMGADDWQWASGVESIPAVRQSFYLASMDGQANDVFHSGALQAEPPVAGKPDRYTYDPLDQRPADLERIWVDAWITDQTYALNLFGRGLVYHSEPFEHDAEITGWPRLTVWIEMDAPDTDFIVTLAEILPDGRHVRLSQDLLRARYRRSPADPKPVPLGEILAYDFSGFTFFSRRITKGSRLRLVIAAPNSIFVEKNYNSGGEVAAETALDARTVHVTLYHDHNHPSCLELPIVK